MPENTRLIVDMKEQMKAIVMATMNKLKDTVPKSPGVPPLILSLALSPAGTAKVALNAADAILSLALSPVGTASGHVSEGGGSHDEPRWTK